MSQDKLYVIELWRDEEDLEICGVYTDLDAAIQDLEELISILNQFASRSSADIESFEPLDLDSFEEHTTLIGYARNLPIDEELVEEDDEESSVTQIYRIVERYANFSPTLERFREIHWILKGAPMKE